MENDGKFKELHIGEMIQAIAIQKGINPKEIAYAINRYKGSSKNP